MSIHPSIKTYADDDITAAITAASKISNKNFEIKSVSLNRTGGKSSYGISATAIITSAATNRDHKIHLKYKVKGENVFASDDLDTIAQRIVAADGDEFTEDFTDYDDQFFGENPDDIQESDEEIEEDEVNIEIENNIADHFIAECDRCQGVFISALIETDQEVEIITGKCPLCEKESDQHLKWIIKDVEEMRKIKEEQLGR